jgi:hypothetical protein
MPDSRDYLNAPIESRAHGFRRSSAENPELQAKMRRALDVRWNKASL